MNDKDLSFNIISWLRDKFGIYTRLVDEPNDTSFAISHDWCGDTVAGFHSEYSIDWDKLQTQMDEFIETLRKEP